MVAVVIALPACGAFLRSRARVTHKDVNDFLWPYQAPTTCNPLVYSL